MASRVRTSGQERPRRLQAPELLAPHYGWLTEGHDTRDLKAAKALLEELGARDHRVKWDGDNAREKIAVDRRGLNLRELTGCCLAFGLAVPTISIVDAPSAAEAPTGGSVATSGPERNVKFGDGTVVPALGQGSARLGQGRHPEAVEEEALREGISLGMTLIDTAEIYGNGDAEKLIGRVIASRRERAFLVSKVWPTHVPGDGIERAWEGSLARLGTNYLDLYLLHWPNGITDLSGVVAAFEN
jgi:hypothetical protein